MKRRRSPGLFVGFWHQLDGRPILERGKPLRVSRAELALAYRLRSDHADIRTGRVEAT
jgi:hypothetical protein